MSSDFGAKGSVPGYDVKTVIDFLQLFNSSWPLLKVQQSGSATITLNGTPQAIATHGLGYVPMYIIIDGGQFNAFIGENYGIGVDSNVIAYDGSSGIGGSFTFYYYIFRLPLTEAFTAPVITGSSSTFGEQQSDYGIKVSKPGKSIHSTDLRDYSLYSSSRSLMVQQVDYAGMVLNGGTGYFERTVTHNLNYIPIAMAYMKWGANSTGHNPTYHYIMPPLNAGVSVGDYSLTTTTMSMRADSFFFSGTPSSTAVILKDPFAKQVINRVLP